MSNQPDLSIVILNYKMDGLVKNCLKSIFEHATDAKFEVIVVDNGSDDDCEALVTKHFPQVQFIQAGGNYGHAKGNNLGFAQATGRYIMMLNPDIVFLDPVIDELITFLEREKEIGMTTLQLKNPDGSLQPGAWKFHKLLTPVFQRSPVLKNSSAGKRHIEEFQMDDWDRKESKHVDWAQGSCLIVRREAFEQIGPLDERFFLYFTDVDWCRRCWDAGWKVHYFADVNVIHYYNRESAQAFGLKSLLNKTTRLHIKDWIRYLRKYRGQPRPR
jgi:N-acetylglucosaminyl-diphospho-decaprenol L-rhamnosyltransferase